MTVRKQILYLVRKLSPLNRKQDEITEANIVPSEVDDNPEWGFLTRIIDIYNFARIGLFNALLINRRLTDLSNFKKDIELEVSDGEITSPSGYVHLISLYNDTKNQDVTVLPSSYEKIINHGTDRRFKPNEKNQMAIERGGKFKLFGTVDGDKIEVLFYKLDEFTVDDLSGTLTLETFPPQLHAALVDISYALALGEGQSDPTAYAARFISAQQ